MEFKPRIITAIFLLFLLLTPPCFSKGGLDSLDVSNTDSGIYDIDYRGPETHSYRPPPNQSIQKPSVHQESAKTHRKSKGFRTENGASGKRIHG